MTSELHIKFAPDVPAMAVEVIAPDLSIVKRMMMSPSQQTSVTVPSEASFLRLYLPSGRSVVLSDPGNLDRVITSAAVQGDAVSLMRPGSVTRGAFGVPIGSDPGARPAASAPSRSEEPSASPRLRTRRDVRRYQLWRSSVQSARQFKGTRLRLADIGSAHVVDAAGESRVGEQGDDEPNEVSWDLGGPSFERPFDLVVRQDDGRELWVRIPGNTTGLSARVDELDVEQARNYSIRLQTSAPVADTILNYLAHGDITAASAMTDWADEAEHLLMSKMSDPYAAAVGAYLLLKLHRFDSMRDWARNLADRFQYVPDGAIVWATQLCQQGPQHEREIRRYLLTAAEGPLPIYTIGLRLLLDGLRLLDDEGEKARKKLRARLGQVIWEAPLTARMTAPAGLRTSNEIGAITFDIEFCASA